MSGSGTNQHHAYAHAYGYSTGADPGKRLPLTMH
jgi:hypothetical protein